MLGGKISDTINLKSHIVPFHHNVTFAKQDL